MGRHLRSRGLEVLVPIAAVWLMATSAAQEMTVTRLGAPAMAQPPAGARGTGAISGRVLDAGTGRPVAGATVRVMRPMPGASPTLVEPGNLPGLTDSVLTNDSGVYVLRDLPKGAYNVNVQAPGYLNAVHGQRVPGGPSRLVAVEDDQRALNVDVRLWRPAAITGIVGDETGEPMINVQVRLFRRTFSGGRPVLSPAGSTQTDDRGQYRFGALVPAAYLVTVPTIAQTVPASTIAEYRGAIRAGRTDTANAMMVQLMEGGPGAAASPASPGIRLGEYQLQVGSATAPQPPDPNLAGQVLVYRAAAYPAATLSPDTATVSLSSGEERPGADIRLELVPSARIFGTVIGPEGPVANIPLRLLPLGADSSILDSPASALDVASTISAADGRFAFLGVPSGEYLLRASRVPRMVGPSTAATVINIGGTGGITFMSSAGVPPPSPSDQPTLWADTPVSVASSDVSDVTVTLRSGLRVSGQVIFEGSSPPPSPEQLLRMGVQLRPIDGQAGLMPLPAGLDAESRFVTGQHRPGRYLPVMPAPPPWTVRSITVDGRDATLEPLDLADADLENVVITLTDRPASLSGTVRAPGVNQGGDATVAVFPVDHQGWIARGMAQTGRHTAVAGDNGAFSVANVLPGEYLVAAIAPDRHVDLEDPSVYAALARSAARVTVEPGAQATVSLSLGGATR